MSQLEFIAFSKDRPAQLDLLLRSAKQFVEDWQDLSISVLHASSDADFARGYERVRSLHPEFSYVAEDRATARFKDLVLELVGDTPFTSFLTDDDVFKASFSLRSPEFEMFISDPEIAALSLRMCPRIDYCYSLDEPAPPPRFEHSTSWEWRGRPGDWGYPMSVDGHIFRTVELRPLMERLEFHNPNTFEGAMADAPLAPPKLICLREAPLVNIPANRVQHASLNRHAGGSAAKLNDGFLGGARLALDPIVGVRNRAPHHEVRLRWDGWRGYVPGAGGPPTPGELALRAAEVLRPRTRLQELRKRHHGQV